MLPGRAALLAMLMVAGAPPAAAQETRDVDDMIRTEGSTHQERRAATYTGLGLSRVSTDFHNLDDAVNLDLALGLRLGVLSWFSGELDLSFTVIPGDNTGPQPCSTTAGTPPSVLDPDGEPGTTSCAAGTYTQSANDLQMTNIGVFGVLRTPGTLYLLGRGGYRFINSSIDEIQDGGDRRGTAYSLGAGWRWGEGLSGLELAYTRYSSQLDYIGVNVAYGFGASSELLSGP